MIRLFLAIIACASLAVPDSVAQSYPVRPIRLLVGFAPGGAAESTARVLVQELSEYFGRSVVIEFRPGAGGALATERVATSPPDGYTLLLATSTDTMLPALNKLPYDLERDFAPITLFAVGSSALLVHPAVPVHNVKELIALLRSQPGKLNYASSGVGSTSHVAGELFKLMTKTNIVHVPYKGGAEAIIANVSGQIEMSISSVSSAPLALVLAGKLRPLAVTSMKRSSLLPAIPTLNESGLSGYDISAWRGVLAPAGVQKDLIARLNAMIVKAANTPKVKELLSSQGFDAQTNTPEQYATLIHNEIAQNIKLVRLMGLKTE